jgi:hypothetical protein
LKNLFLIASFTPAISPTNLARSVELNGESKAELEINKKDKIQNLDMDKFGILYENILSRLFSQ